MIKTSSSDFKTGYDRTGWRGTHIKPVKAIKWGENLKEELKIKEKIIPERNTKLEEIPLNKHHIIPEG